MPLRSRWDVYRALPDRAKRHGNSLCKEVFKRWFVGVGYMDYSGL